MLQHQTLELLSFPRGYAKLRHETPFLYSTFSDQYCTVVDPSGDAGKLHNAHDHGGAHGSLPSDYVV